MNDEQFRAFVQDTAHTAAYFACSPRQKSYSLAALGHGIWSYHLLSGLRGKEPKAALKGYVTGYSLLNFLADEVPRYIREQTTLKGQQTPYGLIGSAGDFSIRAMPVKTSNPPGLVAIKPNFSASSFQSVEIQPFYWLPGFDRSRHSTPERPSSSADNWARSLLDGTIKAELQRVHDNAKSILGLGRKEIALNFGSGDGSVDTEMFRFELTAGQWEDPRKAFVIRDLVLRVQPDDLPANFDEIFPVPVDQLIVPFKGSADFYETLADGLEAVAPSIGGKFEEDRIKKILTLTLTDGAVMSFDTRAQSLVIKPRLAKGCKQVIERLGQGSFFKLLGAAPLSIGTRSSP